MVTYPLNITSKGGNKRKITVADASAEVVAYGEVKIASVHRKETTLYADSKKQMPLAVLTPSLQKKILTFDIKRGDGGTLGSLQLEGGFTTREFEMFDTGGESFARISGEGVGREMAGAVIGAAAGVGPGVGGRADYHVVMQSGATVGITLGKGRSATIEMTGGNLSQEHEQLLLASLVIWAGYILY